MLDLHNEPFQPTGSMDARSARRALGVTSMDFWDVFLRETVQNSWDAHGESSSIDFVIEAKRLDAQEAEVLRDGVFSEVPPSLLEFRESIGRHSPTLLVVADRRTRGLAGPLRADEVPEEGVRNDFCDFVRNIGRDQSKQLDGGTYGFGKSVLYNASSIRTCIIFTQTMVDGLVQARFIVGRVDQQYKEGGKRFTGRHWWGRQAEDGVLDPLVGQAATDLAQALGMGLLGADETGTVLAVVEPDLSALQEPESLASLVEHIRGSAMRWAWPHMVERGDGPTIRFDFRVNGHSVEIEPLESHPVLRHYVSAYRRAIDAMPSEETEESWPTSTVPIRSTRPQRYLGQLAHTKWLGPESPEGWGSQHHVALMRRPHLVVKYLPIDADPLNQQTAGVFIAAEGANDEFALSEPAAHDDWKPPVTPAAEGRRPPSPVRYTLARIVDVFRTTPASVDASQSADQFPGISKVSRMLGDFISGLSGGSEVGPAGKAVSTGRHAQVPKVRLLGSPRLTIHEGRRAASFDFEIVAMSSGALRADPQVVLDRGIERPEDRPAGADLPVVIGWYAGEDLVCTGDLWRVGTGSPTSVKVLQPARSAMSLSLRIEP